jgi:hypothetical protein
MKDQKDAAIKIQAIKRRQTAKHQVERMKIAKNYELVHKSGQKISGVFCIVEVFKAQITLEEGSDDQAAVFALVIVVRASSPRSEFELECKLESHINTADADILKEVGDDYSTISRYLAFDDSERPKALLVALPEA